MRLNAPSFHPGAFAAAAILLFLPVPLAAQTLTFGVVAGTSATGDVHNSNDVSPGGTIPDGETESTTFVVHPGPRGLIIGPKLELRLPWNLSIEAEALHRALHLTETYTVSFSGGSQGFQSHFTETLASWEFPVLGRYHLSRLPLSPFLEAGPSLRPAGSGSIVTHWGAAAGVDGARAAVPAAGGGAARQGGGGRGWVSYAAYF